MHILPAAALATGNAYQAPTAGTGWFLGFGPWTLDVAGGLLHQPQAGSANGLCMKWYDHPGGHDSGPGKPLSEGRTLSILVSDGGEFVLRFDGGFDFSACGGRSFVLQRPGDYVVWGEGLHHCWQATRRSTILTLRWRPSGA